MALAAGTRLGAYEILTLLGSGGMGAVYLAHDSKLGRDVALKILPATVTDDPDRVARFRREAQVLASLNHPHIAQIYDLVEADNTQFLVRELVDGESLDKRIARRKIPGVEASESRNRSPRRWKLPTARASFIATSNQQTLR
jgi:serine/threonine protein kinase